MRLPRKGGKGHLQELPSGPFRTEVEVGIWSLVEKIFVSDDAAAACADFPGFTHHIERTDGCGGQFQRETKVGPISEALRDVPTMVRRHSVIGVSAHV